MSIRPLPVAVALGLAVLIGVGVWLLYRTPATLVNEPPPRLGPARGVERDPVFVNVAEGESAQTIGQKLEDAGVIQSTRHFRVMASLMGVEDELAAGEYEFREGETAATAVRRISRGETRSQRALIREGLRREEVWAALERGGIVPANEFLQALGEDYEASFLAELPEGASLEGYLFPDTYDFPLNATAHGTVQRLLSAFDGQYQTEIEPLLPASGLSLHEVITLASIIEREAQVPEERPIMAGVFLRRIAQGMPLQADPTVQYAIAEDRASVEQFGFWKKGLTLTDLGVASPYNTYMSAGLPPGPIANPGLDAILAVLQPADTSYLYFVARPDGSHIFAETLGEHNRNVCEVNPGCS